MRWNAAVVVCLGLGASLGCSTPKDLIDKVESAQATARKEQPPPSEPTAVKPITMPDLLVDTMGALLGPKRVGKLNTPEGKADLDAAVKLLPVNDSPVTLRVDKKAKVYDVATVVEAFGKAGAPKVIVKSEGRADLPKELRLTPLCRLPQPPSCSIVATVTADGDTGVWPLKGGGGHKARKGLAGPDLSTTAESIKKDLEACESKAAFFSANDESFDFQMAFNVGGTIVKSDERGQIENLVLLGEEPVAGRKVELEFKK
jgi:biopolymer transport protein ExbD